MTYLLDTHTALWYLNDDAELISGDRNFTQYPVRIVWDKQ